MKQLYRSERGQALVLIVLAAVGMFGLAALAIDGGMIYAERRRAQNAADAGVLSGALYMAKNATGAETDAAAKAYAQATLNGFTTGGTTVVSFKRGPDRADLVPAKYLNNQSYYQMVIDAEVQPIFSQFVYSGTIKYTVIALARANPTKPLADGAAMFATSTEQNRGYCDALIFTGTSSTTVTGGSVVSANPNNEDPVCLSGVQNGSGGVTVSSPHTIQTAGGFSYDPDKVTTGTTPDVQQGVAIQDVPELPEPDCSGLTAQPDPPKNGTYTMQPGVYAVEVQRTGGDLTIAPGMYCLEAGMNVNGGTVTSGGVPSNGDGTFFVVKDGDINFGGNGKLTLNRPSNLVDPSGNQWGGFLIYMPMSNDGLIGLGGGGSTTYTGTIYAPGPPAQKSQSKCTVTGSSGGFGLNSQLVCHSVKMAGSGSINITYDPKKNAQVPPTVELIN